MDIQKTLRDIEQRAQKAARGKKWAIGGIYVLSIVFIPGAYSVAVANWTMIVQAFSTVAAVGVIAVLLTVHASLAYLGHSLSTADNFYFDYRDLDREYNREKQRRKEICDDYARVQNVVQVSEIMLIALAKFATNAQSNGPVSADFVSSEISKLMMPIVSLREEVIGYEGARHNIAVYLYHENEGVLRKFFRDAHEGINTQNRDITPPEGHIGYCYNAKKDVFSGDVLEAASHLMFEGEDESTPYRSIAVAPIFNLGTTSGTSSVRGVFIITSDRPGQINREKHEEVVSVLARILSLFFYEADLHLKHGESYV